jgi:hypothetical protein
VLMVAQRTFNPSGRGSNPRGPTKSYCGGRGVKVCMIDCGSIGTSSILVDHTKERCTIMYAKSVPQMIRVHILQKIERDTVAEVSCRDYDEFVALPDAIEVEGKILGKTGWNSDRNYACYKSGVLLGKIL